MKIVFLCTSLAPGRDGVGDYVRQLAHACTANGHVCILVALHDRHIGTVAAQVEKPNEIRMSATLSWSRRADALAKLLSEFDPDWISWQFVPYGFHAKGVLPAGVFALVDVTARWRNHVMLHEIWVGVARSDSLRLRLVGAVQRRKLLLFLQRLRPAYVHTSNAAYQLTLAYHGWPSELLPLFGNMPVLPVKRSDALAELREIAGKKLPDVPHTLGVIFGTIHPQWKPRPTFDWLTAAAIERGQPTALFVLGRIGGHGTRTLDQLSRTQRDIPIIQLGPQPPERISRLLQAADFGIATHPWGLIEKSGSTTTLLEHGLPVLVPRDDWVLRRGAVTFSGDPLLKRMSDFSPSAFPRWLRERREPEARVDSVASRFLQHLSGGVPGGALVA